MDTEYTKGFRAGMIWREAEIIKLLEHNRNAIKELYLSAEGTLLTYYGAQLDILTAAIALIKGENNE